MPRRISTHHTLETIKGPRAPNMFDFQAPAAPTQLTGPTGVQGGIFFSGRCVHLNDNGAWELGAEGSQLPFFLLGNSDDLDVMNDGGDPTVEADAWSAGTPSGTINAVCALGGFELASTEFDAELTYKPNDLLVAPVTDLTPQALLDEGGVMTNAPGGTAPTAYTDAVVGVVTRNRTPTSPKNAHGRDELYFACCYLPGA